MSRSNSGSDAIHIDELLLTLPLAGDDANDEEYHPKAVLLSLTIPHDVAKAARSDDLAYSINYAAVYATLVEGLPKTRHTSLEDLADRVLETLFRSQPQVDEASVVVTFRDASPRFTVETTRRRDQASTMTRSYRFVISKLSFDAIVGLNPQERTEKQPVVFDITIDRQARGSTSRRRFPFSSLSTSVNQTFVTSAYLTVEALASAVACHVLEQTKDPNDEVTVKLSKPNALALAASAQVQITRRQDDFPNVFSAEHLPPLTTSTVPADSRPSSSLHSVALALGSNLGDRFANIETALRLLEVPTSLVSDLPQYAQVLVVDTSFMYETAPMYVIDQPRFANCACMIETNLSPSELLRLVKEIETVVGRMPGVRFGPRAVDVDILTYDDRLVDTRPPEGRASLENLIGELIIPHPRMCEREFVLRPLNDMVPDFVHPACNKTIRVLLDELMSTQTEDYSPMLTVMPFPKYPLDDTEATKIGDGQVPATAKYWILSSTDPVKHGRPHKTRLMATLNMTPDSFSDGAEHNTLPAALDYTITALAAGADIIDIGGYSTRPGADVVSTPDELARVLPIIHAIRAHTSDAVQQALISVDTFRAEVAASAVRAGANCINDVYAFTGPGWPVEDVVAREHLARMRGVARELGTPVVLMHSRGEASANKDYSAYEGIVRAVQTELGDKVDRVVRGPGGVRRWLVLVDPGIGFSKPVGAQLTLMRELGRVTAANVAVGGDGVGDGDGARNALAGYPLLVGPSRKSVWGAVLERPDVDGAYAGRKTHAQERVWATAAAVACAVQQGASVVRVHDVAEMRDVVVVASAIWNIR